MSEQNSHSIDGYICHRSGKVRRLLCIERLPACERIVHARDIECAAPRDTLCRVQYNVHTPFSCHAVNNRAAGVIVFMVADAVPDSVTKVCGVRRENLSGTRVQPLIVEHITRHGEQIRAPRSDLREECVEVLHGEECTEVHVADLRDHHTRRLGRQMRNRDHIVMLHGLMSFNKCAVTTEQQARCRIECRIFQHAPPLRIVRHTARLSPDEPHRHGKHDKRKCNQLCNE